VFRVETDYSSTFRNETQVMAQALLKPAKWITYYKIFDFILVMYATHKLPKAVYCKKKCNQQKPHNTLSINNICTSHSLTHSHTYTIKSQ